MFNNLIESSSHLSELKRRGSFFLFTTATYILLFVIAGVASIYAYDARLEDQNTQIVTMLNPVELSPPKTTPSRPNTTPPKSNPNRQNIAEREIAMAPTDNPRIAPDRVSATPNRNLPVPPSGLYRITGRDLDPINSGGDRPGPAVNGREVGNGSSIVVEVGAPPELEPIQKPVTRVVSKKVINSEALSLPKPPYPPLARQIRLQGAVSVQVLIDETGRVVSARAISGHPILTAAAQRAALEARFSPTLLGEQPVKVSGVIVYNFTLQ